MNKSRFVPKNAITLSLLVTLLLLLFPFIGRWSWTVGDYITASSLLVGTGIVYEVIVKKIRNGQKRMIAGFALLMMLLLIWIEISVGIFD